MDFFGEKYFIVDSNVDKPIGKHSWVLSHVANILHSGSFGALAEIANIIEYSTSLEHSIQKSLNEKKKSAKELRTFFFELYTYRCFDLNNIPNKKKVVLENGQEIEGLCKIDNTEYIFECRKIYMPNISELDIKRRLLVDFYILINEKKLALGMIVTILFQRPIQAFYRDNYQKKIKEYFKILQKHNGNSSVDIQYTIKDDTGIFKAINFTEADRIEIQAAKKFDVMFYLTPPTRISFDLNHSRGKVICNFSVLHSVVYKKLEAVLKEKKQQHKNSNYKKIILIDNETFPEFHMGIFHSNATYNLETIQQIYNKLHLTDILVIIRRYYLEKNPKVEVDIFHQEQDAKTALYLKNVFSK